MSAQATALFAKRKVRAVGAPLCPGAPLRVPLARAGMDYAAALAACCKLRENARCACSRGLARRRARVCSPAGILIVNLPGYLAWFVRFIKGFLCEASQGKLTLIDHFDQLLEIYEPEGLPTYYAERGSITP